MSRPTLTASADAGLGNPVEIFVLPSPDTDTSNAKPVLVVEPGNTASTAFNSNSNIIYHLTKNNLPFAQVLLDSAPSVGPGSKIELNVKGGEGEEPESGVLPDSATFISDNGDRTNLTIALLV